MVTSFVLKQEEETRRAAAAPASQAKQGQWMNWHGDEMRKICGRGRQAMDANTIIHCWSHNNVHDDVLPTSQNLSQWVGEDGSCKLCMSVGSLKHILSWCKTSLTQGRNT